MGVDTLGLVTQELQPVLQSEAIQALGSQAVYLEFEATELGVWGGAVVENDEVEGNQTKGISVGIGAIPTSTDGKLVIGVCDHWSKRWDRTLFLSSSYPLQFL